MSTNVQPRSKDHFSVRLRLPRPGARTGSPAAVIVLAIIQAICLYLTVSSMAATGSLYGCPAACGTPALPAVPFAAMLLGIALIVVPIATGLFSATWKVAIAMTFLPWLLIMILKGGTMLAPALSFPHGQAALGPAFWMDGGRLLAVLLSVVLFAGLGWLGWLVREALADL